MTVDFAKWLSFGAWTAEEGACLLCGIDTQINKSMEASRRMTSMTALNELLLFGHSTSRDEKYYKENEKLNAVKEIKEALERDTRGHIINESSIDNEGRYYYLPIELIRWALSKDFIHVPDELKAFVESEKPQTNCMRAENASPACLIPNPQDPEPEALAQQVKSLNKVSIQSRIKKTEVDPFFSQFENLRANEISVVIMENNTATLVIRGKKITVSPDQLRLKVDSQGWKLLEGAAVDSGDLTRSLKKLNSSTGLEKGKKKIKTVISRLRTGLKNSMGLIDDPISEYSKNGSYKFTFNTMGHEVINGGNISKRTDAMDYLVDDEFNENEHGNNNGFLSEDE